MKYMKKISQRNAHSNMMESFLLEPMRLFDKFVLFTPIRIDPSLLPKGIYRYEIRHDDDCKGIMCELSKGVMINFWGTILSSQKINLNREGYREINEEKDVCYLSDKVMTVEEYLKKFPIKKKEMTR